MKKNLLVAIFLILISIPAVKSLLPPGGYTSHDLTHHIVRLIDLDKLVSEGQFPPRWSGDLNYGYGYPLFVFMYPTPTFLGEAFHKIGFNFTESIKMVLLFSVVLSGVGMYLFLNSLFPNKKLAALLGSVFYLYAPIRFIYLYVSADIGSAFAMAILPFIFWVMVEAKNKKGWAIPVGGILTAILITSHNVTALMFAPVLLTFGILLILKSKERLKLFKQFCLMALFGVGLSAFFWIPAIFEKKYIVYDQVMGGVWKDQFPNIKQLIHSPWGYGLSHPEAPEIGDMSYQIGLTQIAVILLGVITLFLYRKKKEFVYWGVFCLALFSISILLTLKISSPLWQHVPLLYLVQYPYRFISVAVFAAAIMACLLVIFLPLRKIVFAVLLILVLYANRNHLNVNQKFDPGNDYYMSLQGSSTSQNEHLPIWAYLPTKQSPGKLEIIKGGGEINITENKSEKVVAEINLVSDSVVRFNQFYYPGWVLMDNGSVVQFSYNEGGQSQGLPVFNLGAGKHIFEAKFENNLDRKIANYISLGTITLFLIAASVRLTKKKPKSKGSK